jgi:phage terminase Nu1 subunit (DNA packaging protein)
MERVTTKELADLLGVTQGRISQLKTQGRFEGCFTVDRNKIAWDKDAAMKAYKEGNPLVPALMRVVQSQNISAQSWHG